MSADEMPAPDPVDERRRIAEELALLVVLRERVKVAEDERRELIATTWAGGDVVNLELPTDNPARPLKVGTIRADGGQGTARITDPAAWIEWNRQHYPHNVIHQDAGMTSWTLDDPSSDAIALAVRAHEQANGFGVNRVAEFLAVLEGAGYTLTKRQPIPERTVVQPSWEEAVLKLTQQEGTPLTAHGEVPEGVEFIAPSKVVRPVVTIGKNDDTRTRFVNANRHRLLELSGSITAEEQ